MWRLRETGDVVDVVIISPEPGRQKEIGQQLLALADHPRDVQWVTWPQAGFSVPLELFRRFDGEGEDEAAPAAEESTPRRRRPGRPRKQETESTDDTTTSPEEE